MMMTFVAYAEALELVPNSIPSSLQSLHHQAQYIVSRNMYQGNIVSAHACAKFATPFSFTAKHFFTSLSALSTAVYAAALMTISGISYLLTAKVKGCKRVPLPPANIIFFISYPQDSSVSVAL